MATSIPIDEFWGIGGEYLQDPKTGKRTLIARTEPNSQPQPIQNDAIPDSEAGDPA